MKIRFTLRGWLSTLGMLIIGKQKNVAVIPKIMALLVLKGLLLTTPGVVLSQTGKTFIVNVLGDAEDPNVGEPGDDGRCDVDLITPGDQCTMRAAVQNQNANRHLDLNKIHFSIPLPAGTNVAEIKILTMLPPVLGAVIIDGSTQPGFDGKPLIELNGKDIAPSFPGDKPNGLELRGVDNVIKGLVVNSFPGHGFVISGTGPPGAGGHRIESCYIGTDATGTINKGNGMDGIFIEDTPKNTIGGTIISENSSSTGNIISGNGRYGIYIEGQDPNETGNPFSGANLNTILGNYIGIGANGSTMVGNGSDGIHILNSPENIVGGFRLTEGNLIGGNGGNGVSIMEALSKNNLLLGNDIGLNPSKDIILPNSGDGVHIFNAADNTIGALRDQFMVTLRGNLISGNSGDGIHIEGATATGNEVFGNHIGSTLVGALIGNEARPNEGNGILILNAPNNRIGEVLAEARNLISGNRRNGIHIEGDDANNNVIMSNFIGVNYIGDEPLGNQQDGVLIRNSKNLVVGGIVQGQPGSFPGNLISGNMANGVEISSSTNCQIEGNIIGLNNLGNAPVRNGQAGVLVIGSSEITIGGPTVGNLTKRNLISGNQGDGIRIAGPGAEKNKVQNNIVGADITGSMVDPTPNAPNSGDELGNQDDGIHIDNVPNNTIGGVTIPIAEGNIISGNWGNGVHVEGAGAINNAIQGNHIGTSPAEMPLPNRKDGIFINGARNTLIGGDFFNRNSISGNAMNGIQIGPGSVENFVFNNHIGVIPGVTFLGEEMPNDLHGIFINNSRDNVIGGQVLVPGALIQGSNVISANRRNGIHLLGVNASGNIIQLNRIGTDVPGLFALPNINGIVVENAPNNQIGGDPALQGNVISGNFLDGIRIEGIAANNNSIEGNIIGLGANLMAPLPNFNGVRIVDAPKNSIGNLINRGNVISMNFGDGVVIEGITATGNPIRFNSIFDNQELGIDLASDEVTANDPGDQDIGPNNLQNYPVLISAFNPPIIPGNPPPPTILTGSLNSAPNTNYILDFFTDTNGDPTHFGEGETFIANLADRTDESGNVSFTFTLPRRYPVGTIITSTATDPNNNTSEFSGGIGVEGPIDLPRADLEVLKEVDDSLVFVGEQVVMTIFLINKGPDDATGIQVMENETQGFDFQTAVPDSGIYDFETGLWSIGSLANGDTVKLVVTAIVQMEGEFVNTAELILVNQLDPDSSPGNHDPNEDDQDSVVVVVRAVEQPFAVEVIAFNQGTLQNGSRTISAMRSDPSKALGKPQENDTFNFVSLGFGGHITLKLGADVFDDGTAEPEIIVVETSFGRANQMCYTNGARQYPEMVIAEVSHNGVNWFSLPNSYCRTSFLDIGPAVANGMPYARYIRLTENSDKQRFDRAADGYDLDGIIISRDEVLEAKSRLTDARIAAAATFFDPEFFNYAPDEEKELSINLFPVPVNDRLTIETESENGGLCHIQVIDMIGRRKIERQAVVSMGFDKIELNTSSLAHGLYLLQIHLDQQIFQMKFMKD